MVVTFGENVEDGDVIRVWEVDDLLCENIGVTREDRYSVSVGNNEINPNDLSSASDLMGENWLNLGSSSPTGGKTEVTFFMP